MELERGESPARSWWCRLQEIGLDRVEGEYLENKVWLSNHIALFIVGLGGVYTGVSLVVSPAITPFPLLAVVSAIVALLAQRFGFHLTGRFIASTAACVLCTGYHAAMVPAGGESITPLRLSAFAMGLYPWILMDLREWRALVPAVCGCLGAVVFQDQLDAWIEVEVDATAFRAGALYWVTSFASVVITVSAMILMQRRGIAVERERDALLEQLQAYLAVEKGSRVRAEERSLELEAQLLRAQRLEAMGRLAGGIAHDLNNLLTPILGYADLAHETLEGTEDEDLSEGILAAAKRAGELVKQLLAFGKRQRLSLRELDLADVTRAFFPLLRRAVPEDIEVRLELDAALPRILADGGQLEQVLMNLVINAKDAIDGPGRITIGTRRLDLDAEYCEHHVGAKPGRYAVLCVTDTGSGMDSETMKQVFEPFFSTKGDGGTGLGLAMVYGIAAKHGGHVQIDSELGKGSAFQVFFPESTGAGARQEARVSAPGPAPRGSGRVLLAEDEPEVRGFVERALGKLGYEVRTVHDGRAALEAILDPEGDYDLLLTDVVMPKLNGVELGRKATRAKPKLRVILMSGYAADVTERHGEVEGSVFLQKPFSTAQLGAAIREVLDS